MRELGCRAETRHLSYMQIIPVSGVVGPNTAEIIWKNYNNCTTVTSAASGLIGYIESLCEMVARGTDVVLAKLIRQTFGSSKR